MESATRRANVRFKYRDYLLLPEDKSYEILDRELCVVPAPNTRHQQIGLRLKLALFRYVKDIGLGQIFDAPCDVVLSEEDVLQPDILFIQSRRETIIGTAAHATLAQPMRHENEGTPVNDLRR